MKKLVTLAMCLAALGLKAQENSPQIQSIGDKILEQGKESKLSIGGYAQIDYNQKFSGSTRYNGKLDVHRMVMFFGYQFNSRTSFVTEIEYEHVKEVYVEQAFINYNIGNNLSIRGGLMLIPMGIINEYHEPVTFNGVERPNVDKYIVPTTWREIGVGINGKAPGASLKYQLYIVNGFNGFDGAGKFSAKNGLRKGRQKGAESYISSANFSGKIDFYGLKGLSLGLSGYFGKSQSTQFDGLDKDNNIAETRADSSVIGVSMIGLDFRYTNRALQLRGQYIHSFLNNTDEYNVFTGSDIGKQMIGYYLEAGYNVLHGKGKTDLVPFVRYEKYNTQHKVDGIITKNDIYNKTDWTFGLTYELSKGAVAKVDYQLMKNKADDKMHQLNIGLGIWF